MDFPFLLQEFVVLGLLAGALSLDDRAGWQGLAAEPLFASIAVGLLVGEVATGLAVGVVLQLVWLSILPMRGTRRPDVVVGAVVGAGTACLLVRFTGDPRMLFLAAIGVVSALAAGELAGLVTRVAHRPRELRLASFQFSPDGSVIRRLLLLKTFSLTYIVVVQGLMAFILLPAFVYAAEWLTGSLETPLVVGAQWWYDLLPAFGVAALIQIFWHQHLNRFLLLSAVVFWVILWVR